MANKKENGVSLLALVVTINKLDSKKNTSLSGQ